MRILRNLLKLRKFSHKQELSVEHTRCNREILVCGGTGCQSADSALIIDNLNTKIKEAGLDLEVKAHVTGCFGFCEKGPIVKIDPDNVFYVDVKPEDTEEIVQQHLLQGNIIERLLYEEPTLKQKVKRQDEMSFYKKQHRIALRNCGLINPEDIRESIAEEGYMALGKVITTMSQDDIIKLISDSGLRGRGGGGFPTGKKWSFAKKYQAASKIYYM